MTEGRAQMLKKVFFPLVISTMLMVEMQLSGNKGNNDKNKPKTNMKMRRT